MSAAKDEKKARRRSKATRLLVASALSGEAKEFLEKIDADEPELLKILIEVTAAQYLAETKAANAATDPVYKRLHTAQSARFAEELRKLMYLRVQSETDKTPDMIEVKVLGL